jgi:hypothetical protein
LIHTHTEGRPVFWGGLFFGDVFAFDIFKGIFASIQFGKKVLPNVCLA